MTFKLLVVFIHGAVQKLSQQQQESLPQSTADSCTPRLGKEDACIRIAIILTLALFLGIPWLALPDGKFGNPKDSEPALYKTKN